MYVVSGCTTENKNFCEIVSKFLSLSMFYSAFVNSELFFVLNYKMNLNLFVRISIQFSIFHS